MAEAVTEANFVRPENWISPFQAGDKESIRLEIERIGAKSCLEFGPGESTQALIELGLERIVTLEHIPKWLAVAKKRFAKHKHVRVGAFTDTVPVVAELDDDEWFDIAFVDTPKGNGLRKVHPEFPDCARLNACLAALHHTDVVLLHDATRPLERATLGRLNSAGYKITFILDNRFGMARIERSEKSHRPDRKSPPKLRSVAAGPKPKRRGKPVVKRPDRRDDSGPGGEGDNPTHD